MQLTTLPVSQRFSLSLRNTLRKVNLYHKKHCPLPPNINGLVLSLSSPNLQLWMCAKALFFGLERGAKEWKC